MAIIIKGRTPCAICRDLDLSRPFIATAGVAFPQGDELFPYCDAPIHVECLAAWPHRERFSRGYYAMWKASSARGWPTLLAEGRGWMLDCGPAADGRPPEFVEVRLADWPIVLHARWEDWPAYACGAFRAGLAGPALAAAEAAMAEARAVAGTADALARLLTRARAPAAPPRRAAPAPPRAG